MQSYLGWHSSHLFLNKISEVFSEATYCGHLHHSLFLNVINLGYHGYIIRCEKKHRLGMSTSFSKGSFGQLAHIQTFLFEVFGEGIINSTRLHSAYMISEQECISLFFSPIISFNRYQPFLYYLFLQKHFISFCLLISFSATFHDNPKTFHHLVFMSRKYSQRGILFRGCLFSMQKQSHHLFSC